VAERAFVINMGGDDGGGGTNNLDEVESRRIIGAYASVSVCCTTKSRRLRAIMKVVDEGCSEFCITVGTVTWTVGILICCQLKLSGCYLS